MAKAGGVFGRNPHAVRALHGAVVRPVRAEHELPFRIQNARRTCIRRGRRLKPNRGCSREGLAVFVNHLSLGGIGWDARLTATCGNDATTSDNPTDSAPTPTIELHATQ